MFLKLRRWPLASSVDENRPLAVGWIKSWTKTWYTEHLQLLTMFQVDWPLAGFKKMAMGYDMCTSMAKVSIQGFMLRFRFSLIFPNVQECCSLQPMFCRLCVYGYGMDQKKVSERGIVNSENQAKPVFPRVIEFDPYPCVYYDLDNSLQFYCDLTKEWCTWSLVAATVTKLRYFIFAK